MTLTIVRNGKVLYQETFTHMSITHGEILLKTGNNMIATMEYLPTDVIEIRE